MHRSILVILSLAACFAGSSIAQSQSPSELPAHIRASLERNAQLIDPISVEFTQILRPLVPRAEVEEKFNIDPKSQEMYFARRTTKFSLQGFCEYASDSHDLPEVTASGTRWANHWESAFDGTWWQHGSPKYRDTTNNLPMPALTRTHIEHLVNTERIGRLGVRDYFRAIGLSGPETWPEKAAKQRLQSTALEVLAGESSLISVRDEPIDGQRMVRIELEARDPDVARAMAYDFDKANEHLEWVRSQIPLRTDSADLRMQAARQVRSIATMERLRQRPELRRYIWFLDPARDYTIVRYEERVQDGTLLLRGVNSDFFQPPNRAIWLPRKIVEHRYAVFSSSRVFSEPAMVTEIELKSADTAPKDPSYFTLAYTAPGSRTRETGADGRERETTVPREAQADSSPEPAPPPVQSNVGIGRTIAMYAGAACGVVILIAIAGATVRRFRTSAM